jgi:HK97 gp10 family phage protein
VAQTFKIEGLKELEDALRELPKATGKNVLKRALMDAGEPILDAARSAAPQLTGALKRSHASGTKLTRSQKKQNVPESAVEIYVGPGGLVQAITQEFGTVNAPAQPFMRPAWDANKQTALNMVRQSLADEIEKARARLARKAARLLAKGG